VPGRGLWPRNTDSRDALLLRVGVADLPASVSARGQRPPGFVEPVLTGVPVTLDLRAAGVLGIIGPPAATAPAARWIVGQLATLRSVGTPWGPMTLNRPRSVRPDPR
jgi:S-DNA-T family DNA segregation ATPase FtsK/SpoIIIE